MQKVFYCLIILALFSCGEKKLGPIPDLTSLTQSNFVFPYLRVVNGQLSADPSGEFSGNEVPVKLIGAVISNAVSGTNGPKYYKYDNGTSTDYHDSFWTRTAKMSDPHAFLDLVVADLLDAGLNSTRVVLNYCETGGGSVGNGVVGCAVAFDQTQFTRIISLIQYFVGKAQEAGIVVDIDLFDQFTMGSDDAENRVWMSALIEAFKDYRNVIWGLQNEPVARVWRDTIPNNVVAKLATTVSWYDMTADYMRTNDVDSQGRRRHMIGLEDIHASVLDAVTISKYDIAFMHHGNRTAAPGGYLDAVIYKAREKNVNLSIILNELACTDTGATGICRTDEALNEYFKVSIRSINNRLLKKFGSANGGGTNVSVDGGMVWTMYDSCEEITSGVCDIAAGDADHQRSWGVFSCLPDQTCTNRKRSGAVTELAGISFKTNFKALVAPTLEGTLVRGAGTSKNLWDVTLLGPISNNIAANVWNYWAVNPAHFDFDAYTVSAANDSLKLSN
ncbi:MAG TPA: hypothetical protein DCY86_19580 [Bdellovibrionales bacterium]|nr:hypothetical protein [Bdellovibrionales bacterium]